MTAVKEFKLPDLGEGLTEGEILRWLVAPGDTVKVNQPIVEVETAKAAVELPSPYAGVVTKIFHEAGETVNVGEPIISFETDAQAVAEAPPSDGGNEALAATDMVPSPEPEPAPEPEAEPGAHAEDVGGRTAVLVGYGPRSASAKRRPRKAQPPARVSAAAVGETAERNATTRAKATPPVRRMAKQYGLDLDSVAGSGPKGTVTRADVEQALSTAAAGKSGAQAVRGIHLAEARPAVVVAAEEPGEQRVPVHGVRKLMAEAMVRSAFTAPHVTEFVSADVTETMRLREEVAALPEFAGIRVSPLLFVAKALINAVRRTPLINSTWDEEAHEIVVKSYVNLGIAAATPRGLLVPNLKNAEQMTLAELAQALQDLITTARDGRTTPADMQHGTITITNVGVFGIDGGTPIINPGESAILCFGAVRKMPWVYEDRVTVRAVTQLSLSFDHRIIDGELGSHFLSDIAQQLEHPSTLLAWS